MTRPEHPFPIAAASVPAAKPRHLKPVEPENGKSPFDQEFFMVQGVGFRCMAYCNGDGKWRGAFNHEELPGAVRILE